MSLKEVMMRENDGITYNVFDHEAYWRERLEAARKAVEVAEKNLARIALGRTVELTKEEQNDTE